MGIAIDEASDEAIRQSIIWNAITFSKLVVAAFFWSLGFMAVEGEECWGKDTSFSRSPAANVCTVDSFILSGFLASVSLVMTMIIMEIFLRPKHCTSYSTFTLLFISVWISDAFWSLFNWLAFSIAVQVHSDQQQYSLGDYAFGGLFAFVINGLLFFLVHNSLRYAVVSAYREYRPSLVDELWLCDPFFALTVVGAYYGFGPVAVFLIEIIGARSEIAIAVLSAVGTGIGTLFMLVILYWLPMIIWAYSDKEARTSVGRNVGDRNEVIVSAIHKL